MNRRSPDPDLDPQLETRVRSALQSGDLPSAPNTLLEFAARIARDDAPTQPRKLGWVLVLATALLVTAVGSSILVLGGAPRTDPSPSASSSAAVTATGSPIDSPSPTPPSAPPLPTREATIAPAPAVEPAPDNDLALAGRDGVPGLLQCGSLLSFGVDALANPTGAEELPGPEYDVLRDVLNRNVALGAPELGPDPTAREVARDSTRVLFLVDHAGSGPGSGFPYVPIPVEQVDGQWVGENGVDCQPMAVLPPGYEPATWTIDPAYAPPTARTRVLHILVMEHACSSGRSASGRIGPAYVVTSRFQVEIELMVKRLPGGQDCPAAPPTRARLSLPEPIGDRALRDVNEYRFSGTGGLLTGDG